MTRLPVLRRDAWEKAKRNSFTPKSNFRVIEVDSARKVENEEWVRHELKINKWIEEHAYLQ